MPVTWSTQAHSSQVFICLHHWTVLLYSIHSSWLVSLNLFSTVFQHDLSLYQGKKYLKVWYHVFIFNFYSLIHDDLEITQYHNKDLEMSFRNTVISYSQRTIIDLLTTSLTGSSFQNKNIKKSVSPYENISPLNSYLFQPYELTWSAIKAVDTDLIT